jgi:cell division protein FtsI (penicillin-binding protein 3)
MAAQHALRDELTAAKEKYKANAATGLLLDVRTGEVIALSSLPDFDPNKPGKLESSQLNRMTTGAFEMGSTFKALTIAMALDSGMAQLTSIFNAREPLKYGNFTIDDFHAQRRALTVPEIFIHSSNIGSAKMALAVGVEGHKAFLRKMGQLERLRTELPEGTDPLVPKNWSELSTVTIAFGHGLSVAPLQAAMATAALVNGGKLITPTFLKRSEFEAKDVARQVIKPETSDKMRYLMRLNVEQGTAKRAEVEGYYVGGKTGTSEKVEKGKYVKNKLLTSFMGVFPADQPKYLLLVMLDEPQPTPESKGQATSGHNAVPAAGKIIARVAPLLGLKPRDGLPVADRLLTPGRQAAN